MVAEITHLFSRRHTFLFCWNTHPCTGNQDYTKVNVIFFSDSGETYPHSSFTLCESSFNTQRFPQQGQFNSCLAELFVLYFNPCLAQLFVLYFSSFKAGIANAISSFKWRKIFIFFENRHLLNWIIWLIEHLSQTIIHFRWHITWLKNCLKPYISGRSGTRVNQQTRHIETIFVDCWAGGAYKVSCSLGDSLVDSGNSSHWAGVLGPMVVLY